MKVRDAMTRDPITIRPTATIHEGMRVMLDARISGLPVVELDGRLVGVITEGDFMRRAELDTAPHHSKWMEALISPGRLAQEYVGSHGRKVEEIMTTNVATIDEEAALDEAVNRMEQYHIKRLPVLRNGRLTGILSRADVIRAFVALASDPMPAEFSDGELQQRIAGEIDRLPWGPRSTVDVAVDHGMVDLYGVLLDERLRSALAVLVENMPGVKRVRDHLTTIEPVSGMVVSAPQL